MGLQLCFFAYEDYVFGNQDMDTAIYRPIANSFVFVPFVTENYGRNEASPETYKEV